jgi:hypothetical protein
VPQLELIDQTWIGVAAPSVAAHIAEPARWPSWCPDAPLVVSEDRGEEGIRWTLGSGGPMTGSAEVWLQAGQGGVVLHYYLRVDRRAGRWSPRALVRERERQRRVARHAFWVVKDELEARSAGKPGRVT